MLFCNPSSLRLRQIFQCQVSMYSASHLHYITIKPCYHWNLQMFKFSCPLSPNETTFNSFHFWFGWFTPCLFVLPSILHSYSLFTFSTPSSKVQLHSPCPIIKTILPCRSGLLPPPWDEEPAFHRKVISLPWIRSINSIYLACSFHCIITNGKVVLKSAHLTFLTKGHRGVRATPLALLRILFQPMAQLLFTLF